MYNPYDFKNRLELEMKDMMEKIKFNRKLPWLEKAGTENGDYAVKQDIIVIRKHLMELSRLIGE